MPRQFLKIYNETSYGVFANPGSPVLNTDYVVVRLVDNNAFTMREKPKQSALRTADGLNRRFYHIADKSDVQGSLQTVWFPEQTSFFFNWASTISSYDLGSVTIDHAIADMSGTINYTRYLGVKVNKLGVSASADSTPFKLNFDLIAQEPVAITISDFAEPAQSLYPATRPYVFTDMASPGYLSLGSSRSEFAGVDLTFDNLIDAPFFEPKFITAANFCGRNISYSNKLKFKSITDRTNFVASTASTNSMRVDNGTHHTILTFNAQNFYDAVDDDLALDKCYYQTISWQNYYDSYNTADFAFSYT